jgi:plasmid stability protein
VSALHVRNVPEPLLAALRERAERHGRSMQQEVLGILAAAVSEPLETEPVPPIRLVTVRKGKATTWRRKDMYDDESR